MNKRLLLEKYIKVAVKKALKEAEEQQKRAEKALYIIYRFPGLKKLMEDLMSPAFGRYIKHISVVSPKPTTFRVDLINNQDFTITYLGNEHFKVKIAGKTYDPANLSQLDRASDSITTLLQLNYAIEEGKDQPAEEETAPAAPDAGFEADIAAASAPPPTPTGGEIAPPTEETPPPAEETPPA
jgi:hypothetical protein